MSKFVCFCGNVLSEIKYPSRINSILLREDLLDRFLRFAGTFISELKAADSDALRTELIRGKFGEDYPLDVSDSEVIEDALSRNINEIAISMVTCEKCGRLYLQKKVGENEYSCFAPQ